MQDVRPSNCCAIAILSQKIWRALVYMKWIDSHRCVDEGVTVGNCRMNRLFFADELVLHAWMDLLNKIFSTHLIGFLLRAT